VGDLIALALTARPIPLRSNTAMTVAIRLGWGKLLELLQADNLKFVFAHH
jgi:hypothetical protein